MCIRDSDTAMALSIVDALAEHGGVEESVLARRWLERWQREPWRGYGAGMHRLFEALAEGADWQVVARSLFEDSPRGIMYRPSLWRRGALSGPCLLYTSRCV